MGNRDALLDGALRCLLDEGYARTTARDIAAASGTSLAAIGYPFRSTEQLLQEAVAEGFRRWRSQFTLVLEIVIPAVVVPWQASLARGDVPAGR